MFPYHKLKFNPRSIENCNPLPALPQNRPGWGGAYPKGMMGQRAFGTLTLTVYRFFVRFLKGIGENEM